jgi:hypothetical protein
MKLSTVNIMKFVRELKSLYNKKNLAFLPYRPSSNVLTNEATSLLFALLFHSFFLSSFLFFPFSSVYFTIFMCCIVLCVIQNEHKVIHQMMT